MSSNRTPVEWFIANVAGAKERVQALLGLTPGANPVPLATETTPGISERATVAEAEAGVDTSRYVTPAGVAAAIAMLAPLFANNYVFIGAIATTNAPAITLTTLVNTFPATTITPANSGTGAWTLTSNVAGTFSATSLISSVTFYGSNGTLKSAIDVTSDTVVTLTTRGVPGSTANINANNIPFIVISPKP